MRVTVQGLRRWVAVAAVLLIAVVIGFVGYGRYRFRRFEKDLPGRLGVNIQETANGFSYTQSSGGHALFTLKASKEMQLRSGHVLLHDVDITLYGPPGSGRTDHIYGSDFDYDQSQGIATSKGEVVIDLQGAGQNGAGAGNTGGGNTIRVRTSGLTFVQKTGEATTEQQVEFQLPRAAGNSVGADYNSKTGVVVLESQVHITTSSNGKPAVIDADRATLERASLEGFLVKPSMQFATESGSADAGTVYFRKDGTTERVDAEGDVRMRTDSGARVQAAAARILLDAKSQPTEADLSGGVEFGSENGDETMEGSAGEGRLLFATFAGPRGGTATALRHAEFRGNVKFTEATAGEANEGRGRTERELQGQKVDVGFAPPVAGHGPQAQRAIAEGNPVLTMEQTPVKGPGQTTRISGDRLVANLGADNVLKELDGSGHTQVAQSGADGSHDVSTGDVLRATFVQQPAPVRRGSSAREGDSGKAEGNAERKRKKAKPGPPMETVLETAVQDGNVVLAETPARKPGATAEPATLRGWAGHAEYRASDQVLHLTGNARITDGETMQLAAEGIDYHRDTQDASASGDVKATYTQERAAGSGGNQEAPMMGGNGPEHVIAERATMKHAENQDFFYGTVREPARMWQEADSLLAPAIEIDRNRNELRAWGENTGKEPVVNANFTTAMGAKHEQSVIQMRSETLIYSDRERRGDFHGSVTATQGSGDVACDDALVYLKPVAGGHEPAAGAGRQNSQLDRLVATGNVIFTQPGRRGEGQKLIYTAADGKYVLTGTATKLPTMWDRVHGTTTGAALIFNGENDTVEVSGGKGSAVTDTRAPK